MTNEILALLVTNLSAMLFTCYVQPILVPNMLLVKYVLVCSCSQTLQIRILPRPGYKINEIKARYDSAMIRKSAVEVVLTL